MITDTEVARPANELGLVTTSGALIPTEIVHAHHNELALLKFILAEVWACIFPSYPTGNKNIPIFIL